MDMGALGQGHGDGDGGGREDEGRGGGDGAGNPRRIIPEVGSMGIFLGGVPPLSDRAPVAVPGLAARLREFAPGINDVLPTFQAWIYAVAEGAESALAAAATASRRMSVPQTRGELLRTQFELSGGTVTVNLSSLTGTAEETGTESTLTGSLAAEATVGEGSGSGSGVEAGAGAGIPSPNLPVTAANGIEIGNFPDLIPSTLPAVAEDSLGPHQCLCIYCGKGADEPQDAEPPGKRKRR